MTDAFTLSVPADGRYRGLGSLVAAKYAEVAGGSVADVQALAAAVTDAIDKVAPESSHGTAQVDLSFQVRPDGVHITARCGTHSSVVTRPLAAHHR